MSFADPVQVLAGQPLFAGVPASALEEVRFRLHVRRLAAGDALCTEGEDADSLFVIASGLAHVLVGEGVAPAAKLRRGDVVGEMALLTGEPRSATVVAAVPTVVVEVDRGAVTQLLAQHSAMLENLTGIVARRLRATTAQLGRRSDRGEAVTLVTAAHAALVPELIEATRTASAGPVGVVDARDSVEDALARLDDVLAEHRVVLLLGDLAQETLPALLDAADRSVAVVAGAGEAVRVRAVAERSARREVPDIVRKDAELDLAWLGRHLAGTKLGLALGAGGAKGYAHVGVLHALERAGHVVDYVAGSSIGAIVGAWLGLGMTAAEVEATMRTTFSPETVEAMFHRSFSGAPTGLVALERAFRESTHDATFADLRLPLVVMTVDLNRREPAPITEGPLWQALLAATALAGVYPPVERDGARLVDGLALVPVPTGAVHEAGADVSLAVNLIARHTLPSWPGGDVPEPTPQFSGSRTLDALLEVMDLGQLDASERQAASADVRVTPRFGPSTWRDFHLADRFLEAGFEAAELERPALERLVPRRAPAHATAST